jgi:hypothetical protein
VLNALFEKAFLFMKGRYAKGVPQHLMQNQLLKLLQQVMKGILSVVDESKMTFALSFCAACVITSAYALAVNAANLSFLLLIPCLLHILTILKHHQR